MNANTFMGLMATLDSTHGRPNDTSAGFIWGIGAALKHPEWAAALFAEFAQIAPVEAKELPDTLLRIVTLFPVEATA